MKTKASLLIIKMWNVIVKEKLRSIKTDFKSADHSANYNIHGDNGIETFRFINSDNSFKVGTLKSTKTSMNLKLKMAKQKFKALELMFMFLKVTKMKNITDKTALQSKNQKIERY